MPEQRCKRIFAMLSALLDGELAAKNCRELARHLKGCPPCIAYLKTLKTTIVACRKYKVPRTPAPSKKVKAALLAVFQRSHPRQ